MDWLYRPLIILCLWYTWLRFMTWLTRIFLKNTPLSVFNLFPISSFLCSFPATCPLFVCLLSPSHLSALLFSLWPLTILNPHPHPQQFCISNSEPYSCSASTLILFSSPNPQKAVFWLPFELELEAWTSATKGVRYMNICPSIFFPLIFLIF